MLLFARPRPLFPVPNLQAEGPFMHDSAPDGLPRAPEPLRPGAAPPPEKLGHATGPRTPAGKAVSSMNRLTHGLRSEKTVLRDEDPAEFEATVQSWLDHYQPRNQKEDELVRQLSLAQWKLKRANKRLEEIEWNLPGNAWTWTVEHQHLFATFTRYQTTAERSFNRWFRETEAHRGRQFREDEIREKARIAAAAVDLQWLSETEIKTNKALVVKQIVEIDIDEGECITACFPENEEIVEAYEKRSCPPILVKRILMFLKGVPPEYAWANPKWVQGSAQPQAVQNMLWSRWLNIIDREEALEDGHVGPLYSLR